VHLYRIEKQAYINTFPPRGSLFAEGRWNRRGMWVVYTSETVALAKLEALANSGSKLPDNRYLTTIDLNDQSPVVDIPMESLPSNWNKVPYPKDLAYVIKQVIDEKQYIAALAPSIHSPMERNVLLFPDNPEFGQYVKLVGTDPVSFDQRLK
jgi:RES domain-containing protein